jgi:hypothetical protein
MERERNLSIRTPAKHVKVHENLIRKARFSRSLLLTTVAKAKKRRKKGKVKFIFGLFCGFTAAFRVLVFISVGVGVHTAGRSGSPGTGLLLFLLVFVFDVRTPSNCCFRFRCFVFVVQ